MIHYFLINQFIVLKTVIINIIAILKCSQEIKQVNKAKFKNDLAKILLIQISLALNLHTHDIYFLIHCFVYFKNTNI